jgi:hypothetical protein
MHADGCCCLQPKKATKIYYQKSANQCTSNAGKARGFFIKQNKPYETNILFVSAPLLNTKLMQSFLKTMLKQALNELFF